MTPKKNIIYFQSNADNFDDLKKYCETMFRDIIEKVNGDIEPTFIEQRETPKNPKLGTVYYASGVTYRGTSPYVLDPPTGWDPSYKNLVAPPGIPTAPNALGTGKGLWVYTESVPGTKIWKRLDT